MDLLSEIFQIMVFLFGIVVYVIIPVILVKVFLDYQDIVCIIKRVIQLALAEWFISFCLYLTYIYSINELRKTLSYTLFVLKGIGVIVLLFLIIKKFYNDKTLKNRKEKLPIFLSIVFYSICHYTMIYFFIMLMDSNNFLDDGSSVIEKLVNAFYFSVTNYLDNGPFVVEPNSIVSKIIASSQNIFSFVTIVIGITFFIKDEECENKNIGNKKTIVKSRYRCCRRYRCYRINRK